MDSKERMLAALWNQEPDSVPVAPDTSNYIPCRMTGRPYWDICLYNRPDSHQDVETSRHSHMSSLLWVREGIGQDLRRGDGHLLAVSD
jgi:hypothetical protein